jgi:lipid-A-disaccharide synthase-like uncharacterized protein
MPSLELWAVGGIDLSWSAISPWLWNHAWMVVGLCGQAVFTARFLVQWLASERKKDSVMPTAFWWLSLFGGLITLVYAIHLQSLPFVLGQSMGLFVYVRNLMLVTKKKRRAERRKSRAEESSSAEREQSVEPAHQPPRQRPQPHHHRPRGRVLETGQDG